MALEVASHRDPALAFGYLAVKTTTLGDTRPGPESLQGLPLARPRSSRTSFEQEAQLS